VKVFSMKFGSMTSFGAAKASNPCKTFLPRKFPAIQYKDCQIYYHLSPPPSLFPPTTSPHPPSFLQHTQQFVQDLTIANLGITNFRGLENLRTFANEFSIWNNPSLTTIAQLGANLPPSYRTSIRNLAIRDNPLLADVGGLRILSNITGR